MTSRSEHNKRARTDREKGRGRVKHSVEYTVLVVVAIGPIRVHFGSVPPDSSRAEHQPTQSKASNVTALNSTLESHYQYELTYISHYGTPPHVSPLTLNLRPRVESHKTKLTIAVTHQPPSTAFTEHIDTSCSASNNHNDHVTNHVHTNGSVDTNSTK